MPFRDLREFVSFIEGQGKLVRLSESFDKDTEIMPFYRVQMLGLPSHERRALLFENVRGAQGQTFEMQVLAGCYGASDEMLLLGLGCDTYLEALEKFHEALINPLPPVIVESGEVQEEVHLGDELARLGLAELPAPVEEVGFSGTLRTGLPQVTRDPDSGIYNVGTINGFFLERDRLTIGISPNRDAQHHLRAARARGEDLPIAIVIGCTPDLMVTSSTQIPYATHADEFAVAGALSGSPLEMVRCKTIPLEVPAHAEAIIEGYMSPTEMALGLPFAEYPGYMRSELNTHPVMRVTAITHRKKAMFTPITVGFWPNDSNTLAGFGRGALVFHTLKYEQRLPVREVYFPQAGGGTSLCFISVEEGTSQNTVWEILEAAKKATYFKYVVAVDHDANLRSSDFVWWAMTFSSRMPRDLRILQGGGGGNLDPSVAPAGSGRGHGSSTQGLEDTTTLINATRKFAYPPVALPRREHMERALQRWHAAGLPEATLQQPWFGYTLGFWPTELDDYARQVTQGQFPRVEQQDASIDQVTREEPASAM